ncbi:STAS domain-containing protein [Geodermatophilus sp. SYSU D00703]
MPVAGGPSAPPAGRASGGAEGEQGWGQADEPTGWITVRAEAGGHVLHLTGDVDAPVLQQFAREHAVDRLRVLAVDVDELAYIDSAGLTFLVRWAQSARAEGRPARIRRATRRFARVLELSGLTSLFDLTPPPPPPTQAPPAGR